MLDGIPNDSHETSAPYVPAIYLLPVDLSLYRRSTVLEDVPESKPLIQDVGEVPSVALIVTVEVAVSWVANYLRDDEILDGEKPLLLPARQIQPTVPQLSQER